MSNSPLKHSIMLIEIDEITDDAISYYSKVDVGPKVRRHRMPASSKFPYKELETNTLYVIIAFLVDGTWFWVSAYKVSGEIIVDPSFQ